MIGIHNKNWFYRKIFIIDNEELFNKFKETLKNRNIVNLRNEFEKRDFNKFKFDKDKPYYRITSKSSYGSGSLKGYEKFKDYYEYKLIKLNNISTPLECILETFYDWVDYEDLGLFKSLYELNCNVQPLTKAELETIINGPPYIFSPSIPAYTTSCVTCNTSYAGDIAKIWKDVECSGFSEREFNSDNKKEDKENIMKLLEIYKDRRTENIYKVESEKKEEISLTDKDYAAYKKLNSNKVGFFGDFSDEIKKKFAEIEAETKLELGKVESMIREVEAQLEICETYDQKVSVLKLYNILDEEGKLSI